MNLVRFEPWSIFDQLHRDLNRATLRDFTADRDEGAITDWVPAVDVVEHNDRFVVRADLPGVEPTAIDVSMDAGVLTIAGERHAEDRSDADGMARYERVSGRFFRRFSLPDTADAERITAKSTHGILEISIPKLPEVQPRRITVEAA